MQYNKQLQHIEPRVLITARELENWFSYYGQIRTKMPQLLTTIYEFKLRQEHITPSSLAALDMHIYLEQHKYNDM